MKKWKSYFLAVIAAICMLWIFPEHTPAATNEAVISVEKGTLGQGYIIEPTAVTLQSGDTVKTVTERVLEANSRSALTTMNSTYGYYLQGISDPNRGAISIPAFVQQMITAKNLSVNVEDIKNAQYLNEFDYTPQSGWMYCVNNVYPEVGAASTKVSSGDVIRWQFTLVGQGQDLKEGDPSISASEKLNRDNLYKTMAYIHKTSELMNRSDIRAAYVSCINVLGNLTSKKSDLTDYGTLNLAAQNIGIISPVDFVVGESNTSAKVSYGTPASDITFPTSLIGQKNTISDTGINTINIWNVTWQCADYNPQKPGFYDFKPIFQLNEAKYILKTNASLPTYKVTVLKENGEEPDPVVPDRVDPKPVTPQEPTVSNVNLSVGRKTVNVAYAKKTLNLNIKAEKGASVSVKSANKKVVSIDKKKRAVICGTGKTEITVTASLKGKKTTVLKIPVSITPIRQSAPALKSSKSRQMTVSWKKDTRATGYQIMYSTDKKFRKNVKTVNIKKYKTTRCTVKKLARNKRYYVRLRSYKKVSGGKLYGSWSSMKNVKIKK
ncbi:DUF4430 domain-containing protein [Blautia sp. 2744]|uniref:DUF4430 domain-containing protein n=1 Tax=Blautia intestinalis TaxID=2763028 RepID=A0ABR7HZC8_9FIRM|nr:DUF4430 domain-containing protein [Blautia intestinalis]MBC5739620.1 DUF4430 domain-containing protein [Blautia intestinalis]